MSALANLQQHLNRFWALPHHKDAALNTKLKEVQAWQQARIKHTHSALFEQPKNKPMADYFLTQLYGGDEVKVLAEQLGRILPKAKKLERLAKEASLEAGSMGIQASILAIELDLHLAEWLVAQDFVHLKRKYHRIQMPNCYIAGLFTGFTQCYDSLYK